MKKGLLVFLGISNILLATELNYGNGTFSMQGGFLGAVAKMDTDISTYSIVSRHANLFENYFYAYDINWYESKTLNQMTYDYNNLASSANNFFGTTNSFAAIPAMKYTFQGLDANAKIGYDIIHKDEDNYLGIGALLGISLPWIESSQKNSNSSNNKSSSSTSLLGEFPDTKTSIKTYKLGTTVSFQKSLIDKKISLYGTGSYAYQTGKIENDYISSSYSVDGTFQEYNIGLYFTPFTETYKWGFLTLSPRIYGTIGYKYSKWSIDKMTINMSGQEVDSDILSPLAMEFNMNSSIGYFGVGYSF